MALDFRNFYKRLIVILKEEKRMKEAYERWNPQNTRTYFARL